MVEVVVDEVVVVVVRSELDGIVVKLATSALTTGAVVEARLTVMVVYRVMVVVLVVVV